MLIHVVKQGDTLWKLSRRYGVSVERLTSDNGIADPRRLMIGQALAVLQPAQVYTVRRGDTVDSIARRFGLAPIELIQNNPDLAVTGVLRPGRTLSIRFEGEKRRTITINGYVYPHVQRAVLAYALPFMTYVTIFGYGFTLQGGLIPTEDQPIIDLAARFQAAPVMLLSSITEDGTFDSGKASALFENPALQEKVLDEVLAVMLSKGYVGLDIDFEYIRPEDTQGYLDFISLAAEKLNPYGFFINTDLAPKTSAVQRGLLYEAHDYAQVGSRSDTVLLMTYEWGHTGGPPMAVAPLDMVRQVVEYAVSEIPAKKIMLGLPNYGYVWRLPFERGVTLAASIGNQYAVTLAARHGAEIQFDNEAASPFFRYYSGGKEHVAWFEDVRSISAKFELIDAYDLLGGSYWNLMRPFNQNFAFLSGNYQIRKVQ